MEYVVLGEELCGDLKADLDAAMDAANAEATKPLGQFLQVCDFLLVLF